MSLLGSPGSLSLTWKMRGQWDEANTGGERELEKRAGKRDDERMRENVWVSSASTMLKRQPEREMQGAKRKEGRKEGKKKGRNIEGWRMQKQEEEVEEGKRTKQNWKGWNGKKIWLPNTKVSNQLDSHTSQQFDLVQGRLRVVLGALHHLHRHKVLHSVMTHRHTDTQTHKDALLRLRSDSQTNRLIKTAMLTNEWMWEVWK